MAAPGRGDVGRLDAGFIGYRRRCRSSGFGAWKIAWTPLEAGDEVGHLLNHALERPRPLRPNRTPSRQCQGTAFCHLRNAGSQEGLAVLHHRLDQGVNFFDSAQAYG